MDWCVGHKRHSFENRKDKVDINMWIELTVISSNQRRHHYCWRLRFHHRFHPPPLSLGVTIWLESNSALHVESFMLALCPSSTQDQERRRECGIHVFIPFQFHPQVSTLTHTQVHTVVFVLSTSVNHLVHYVLTFHSSLFFFRFLDKINWTASWHLYMSCDHLTYSHPFHPLYYAVKKSPLFVINWILSLSCNGIMTC